MWRDLSRLVDVECKKWSLTLKNFQAEVVGELASSWSDVNMPQAGLCDKKLLLVENRNHACVEGSLQVS